ncbi:MAG: aminotransferase class I/II-fold pyridoxal phosphate-dependent enzyme [Ignavibacteriales bacterium]|nr:MAG: aminotransferase class I/II-fold pyridoxal phosphate-dependent enzyme [Ignavibacteriaceae bacterium]MBW7872641.1 aminotransferase class I/II-fold pyridoxal phosphate-dependent enzyme [Ignavibacteria bacterium]MCZ2141805.1 aminotransferase class I/II-fold pyridoxal phosphate-dependent enzyme [Ignavibacteriales bacterium]OQY75616.1 MAG: methionine aminotransferase [Ignavibacteriales bacterium UTCHB3]MBV6444974.1 Methionine aminotransferase [Ignavibacteriaceae bacterium]
MKSKLPGAPTSIFAVMSALANQHKAVNLSQGFPDFDLAPELIELMDKNMRAGNNQYAPMPGVPALREEIARKIKRDYGREYNPDTEITITSGATQALFTAFNSFIFSGDEVVIIEPAYDSYYPSVVVNGGVPVPVPLDENAKFDWERIKSAISPRTKMIVLNSPHNPLGSAFTPEDIEALTEIVRNTDILIVSDEVYEHIIFDGRQHLSMARYPELAERAIVISSFGKTFHATGWKVGYIAAPAKYVAEFRKVHQFTVFAVNTPAQFSYAEYLKTPDNYLQLADFYQKKRDFLNGILGATKLKFTPAEGTYFQIYDYSAYSDEDDFAFAKRLTTEAGTAVIPISPFCTTEYTGKKMRVCFAKKDPVIKEGAERLLRFFEKL